MLLTDPSEPPSIMYTPVGAQLDARLPDRHSQDFGHQHLLRVHAVQAASGEPSAGEAPLIGVAAMLTHALVASSGSAPVLRLLQDTGLIDYDRLEEIDSHQ